MQQNCSENELSAVDPCAVAIAFHHHSTKAVKWEGIWITDYEGREKKDEEDDNNKKSFHVPFFPSTSPTPQPPTPSQMVIRRPIFFLTTYEDNS